MKNTEVLRLEKAIAIQSAWNKLQNKATLSAAPFIIAGFILPRFIASPFDLMVMALGPTVGLTIMFSLIPDSFRSRSGSLKPAIGLVVALWVAALVECALSLAGAIH